MADYITTAEALNDPHLRQRISAALLMHVSLHREEKTGADAIYAEHIMHFPSDVDATMVALVVSNPSISEQITRTDGVVDTSGVPDGDIEYVCVTSFSEVAKKYAPALAQEIPESVERINTLEEVVAELANKCSNAGDAVASLDEACRANGISVGDLTRRVSALEAPAPVAPPAEESPIEE